MGGLKCKMCGSNLDIGDSITVCKCEKCGTSQTVPDIEDDKELKLFERAGRLRFNCDFDKAAGIYNTITDSYTEEAEEMCIRDRQEPVADFCLCDGEQVEEVYAYCNLHGLWKC